MMPRFKQFLLNENKAYFAQRVGDLLSAMQNIEEDIEQIGSRRLNVLAENIVNRIRRILHTSWTSEEKSHLPILQKIGVHLMKTIEEKGDIKESFLSCTRELEQLSSKIGLAVSE